VTRLIIDGHDAAAFAPVAGLTVGEFRDWLLSDAADGASLQALAPGLTPEMVAAVSKLMRNQDLILVAAKCQVITRFRNTLGLPGRLAVRLQPNHPTDDPRGIAASMLDGLLYGVGDAVIGINPATDSLPAITTLLRLIDDFREQYAVPTQSCVLTHVTNTLRAIEKGAPVDLVFQSIGGTEAVNRSFGVSAALLDEANAAALALGRGSVGNNVMYFETGQGRRCRPTPTTAPTSSPWRPGPTAWRGVPALPGEHRGGLHRAGVPLRRQADHPRRAGRPLHAASCWASPWAATSATPTTPRPTRTTWTPC
jgi:ethanolamine ammonia-lyase large subunit